METDSLALYPRWLRAFSEFLIETQDRATRAMVRQRTLCCPRACAARPARARRAHNRDPWFPAFPAFSPTPCSASSSSTPHNVRVQAWCDEATSREQGMEQGMGARPTGASTVERRVPLDA